MHIELERKHQDFSVFVVLVSFYIARGTEMEWQFTDAFL